METDIKKLVLDDDVTKKAGIIPFILSDRTWRDEKHLSLRAFTESQKLRAYERQGHKCPLCVANGINTEYAFEDMEGDHIIPWSKGGHTTDDNLQMLCKKSAMRRSRISDILQLLTVGLLCAEVVTNFLLEIRREYGQTNRIKEISKVEDNA